MNNYLYHLIQNNLQIIFNVIVVFNMKNLLFLINVIMLIVYNVYNYNKNRY